ncbi:MAG TPA: GNAT family N-acetyltransferase [Allosphingosinicella sp.]|nr:GNAT family N-acetyltransferase [Allosphingosinicella sp.]
MDARGFDRFSARVVPDYAAAKAIAGDWDFEGAAEKARNELKRLLPGGLATPGNHLFSVRTADDQREVGQAWIAERRASGKSVAFLLDLFIHEGERRRGFGRSTMTALEDWACRRRMEEMRLHVFDDNAGAAALYRTLGYRAIAGEMFKPLPTRREEKELRE